MFIRVVAILLVCGLIGCSSGGRSPDGSDAVSVYVVQRGDTLYSIAFRYGLDYRKVAEVNRIYDPYVIYPGQNIYLWQVASSSSTGAGGVSTASAGAVGSAGVGASSVVVTAVPGIAAAPVSKVEVPSTSGSQGKPPVNTGLYHPNSAPVQAPAIETPPIKTTSGSSANGSAPGPAAKPAPAPAVARAPKPTPSLSAAPTAARPPKPGGKVTAWRWPASGSVTRSYSSSVHKGIDIGGSRGEPIRAVADGTVVYAGTGIVGFGELLIVKHNDIYISAYGHNDRLLVNENDIVGGGQVIAEKGSSGTDTVKLHFEIRKEGKPVNPLKLLPRR